MDNNKVYNFNEFEVFKYINFKYIMMLMSSDHLTQALFIELIFEAAYGE